MSSHGQGYSQWLCKPCFELFPTWEALREHRRQKRLEGVPQHIQCTFCGQPFDTEKAELLHLQQNHGIEQNLECPACGSGPFLRLGSFMAHIEDRECAQLNVQRLDELREEKIKFTRRIQELTKTPIKNDYSRFVSPKAPPVCPQDWAIKSDDQSNDAPPTTIGRDANAQYITSVRFQGLEPDHPHHPAFDIQKYYSLYTEKYHCPKSLCTKGFPSQRQLRSHLMSAHDTRVYRCPYCQNIFRSLSAIAQHAEAAGVRCRLRDSDDFESYIDQLTAGLVEVVEGRDRNGNPIYKINPKARDLLSEQTQSQRKKAIGC